MILTLLAYALGAGRLVKHGEDRDALVQFTGELIRLDTAPVPAAPR